MGRIWEKEHNLGNIEGFLLYFNHQLSHHLLRVTSRIQTTPLLRCMELAPETSTSVLGALL